MGRVGNIGVACLYASQGFPLSSFRLGLAREIGVLTRHVICGTCYSTVCRRLTTRPPWSTLGSCGHPCWWRRLCGPVKSQPSLPQSLWLTLKLAMRTERSYRWRSALAGGSTPSRRIWRQRRILYLDWSGWRWCELTWIEWCISCTYFYFSKSTFIRPNDVCLPAWSSCLPSVSPWWWRSQTKSLRRGVHSRRAANGSRHPPWGDLPSRLTDEAMREGGEGDGSGVRWLGLPGVWLFPPPNCAACLIEKEADGPLNAFEASKGLFLMLTGR